jgi:hypothetical protein
MKRNKKELKKYIHKQQQKRAIIYQYPPQFFVTMTLTFHPLVFIEYTIHVQLGVAKAFYSSTVHKCKIRLLN